MADSETQTSNIQHPIKYSEFGAVGDGITDDFEAIAKAHAFANQQDRPVKADDEATYYIGGDNRTVEVQTDTDFGKANFIIDDRAVENRRAHVFRISSKLKSFKPEGITSLKRNQRQLTAALPGPCLVRVTNANVKHYIRYGNNQNNGSSQTDVFLVDPEGHVDMKAPVVWDFEQITDIQARPVDQTTLTIRGGTFTTLANAAESKYTYYARGIAVRRSNVEIIGLEHYIKDGRYWGIMGSNYCKNLLYDGCNLSRFDAHKGVANATIRNSTLGHAGINAIGHGTLTVENTTVYGRSFVNLRSDYGSTWKGEFIFRNCVFVPACGRPVSASLIGGSYSGQHDFGYPCHMPERITIDTLLIDDSSHPDDYRGPSIFANFNRKFTDSSYVEKFPYHTTREVILENVTTKSGKPLRVRDNPIMFKDVVVKRADEDTLE